LINWGEIKRKDQDERSVVPAAGNDPLAGALHDR
jgi:hypothetical protein